MVSMLGIASAFVVLGLVVLSKVLVNVKTY